MSLLVIGAPQALATAAWASALTGETVHVDLDHPVTPGIASIDSALLDGDHVPVHLEPAGHRSTPTAVIVVTESRQLRAATKTLVDLPDGLPVLLAPGGFAGALRVRSWLPNARVAEATGFPVAGSLEGTTYRLGSPKRSLPVAAADPDDTPDLVSIFSRWLPHLVESSVLTTSLANTNHLIHPPVTLLNAARIDNQSPFILYRDGISDAVDGLLTAVDAERVALCRAVGADDRSGAAWMRGFYEAGGMTGSTLVECLDSYPGFERTPGPNTLEYRYLHDDVPHGIAAWAAVARHVNLPTPVLDALLTVLHAIAPHIDMDHDADAVALFLDAMHAQHRTNASA